MKRLSTASLLFVAALGVAFLFALYIAKVNL